MTRLLLTRIPMFREVIVTSFYCHHCGYSNNEIQDGGDIQDDGVRYCITVNTTEVHFTMLYSNIIHVDILREGLFMEC